MHQLAKLSDVLYSPATLRLRHLRLTILKTGVKLAHYEKGVITGHGKGRFPNKVGGGLVGLRREDNLSAVRTKVHDLVDCNVRNYGYEPVFLTFTFARNETNIKAAWKDWRRFIRLFKKHYGDPKYLAVVEFQNRGAVHFHCIFFNYSPELERMERCPHGKEACDWQKLGYCSLDKTARPIARLWGQGWVDVERVRSARNVAAYVTSYLDKSAGDARLRGIKFFATSKGLVRPEVLYDEEAEVYLSKAKEFDPGRTVRFVAESGNVYLTMFYKDV